MTISYPTPPTDCGSDEPSAIRRLARSISDVVGRINQGKFNATGEVTLTASSTTTTLTDPRLTGQSVVVLVPLTANARTIAQSTGYYISGRLNGSCTINHASNAAVDLTYSYLIIG